MIKEAITFKPKQVVKNLLATLTERARDVVRRRYGLDEGETMTLEAVGKIYNITRERVRQIEEFALKTIKKSPAFGEAGIYFDELSTVMENYGGIVHEQEFLSHLTKDVATQNHVHLLLVLGDAFTKLREDEAFHHRWTTSPVVAEAVQHSLRNLFRCLGTNDLMSEDDILKCFGDNLHENLQDVKNSPDFTAKAKRWLRLSKDVGVNPMGEWGLAKSPHVKLRGIRDYAFLVLRRGGKPLHFTEVAKAITETFKRRANAATTHNELIKDKRFVLVGRGIYGLAEWGYTPGIVREVIRGVLAKKGPMTKDEVLEAVLKERYVKPSTVLINLKNPRYFKQSKEGKFSVVK
jgi:hypothetical protein